MRIIFKLLGCPFGAVLIVFFKLTKRLFGANVFVDETCDFLYSNDIHILFVAFSKSDV